MRQLKFRVWDKKYHTFDFNTSPDLFISTDGEVYEKDERNYGMQTYTEYNKSEFYEINQYTGLKDKNGKKIYEGDIVTGKRESHWHGGYDKIKGSVEFSESNLSYMIKGIDGMFGGSLYNVEELEVIGNLYELEESE